MPSLPLRRLRRLRLTARLVFQDAKYLLCTEPFESFVAEGSFDEGEGIASDTQSKE